MTNTKNGSNQGMVPEARAAMDRFKMEAAADLGVSAPTKESFTTYRLTQAPSAADRQAGWGFCTQYPMVQKAAPCYNGKNSGVRSRRRRGRICSGSDYFGMVFIFWRTTVCGSSSCSAMTAPC